MMKSKALSRLKAGVKEVLGNIYNVCVFTCLPVLASLDRSSHEACSQRRPVASPNGLERDR